MGVLHRSAALVDYHSVRKALPRASLKNAATISEPRRTSGGKRDARAK